MKKKWRSLKKWYFWLPFHVFVYFVVVVVVQVVTSKNSNLSSTQLTYIIFTRTSSRSCFQNPVMQYTPSTLTAIQFAHDYDRKTTFYRISFSFIPWALSAVSLHKKFSLNYEIKFGVCLSMKAIKTHKITWITIL